MDELDIRIIDAIKGGMHTSRLISDHLGIRTNRINNRLKSLCKYGFFKRRPYDEHFDTVKGYPTRRMSWFYEVTE